MTALAISGYPLSASLGMTGTSPEATTVQRLMVDALHRIKQRADQSLSFLQLFSLERELQDERFPRLEEAPFELAERFLVAWPTALPPPELSADPDGDISFNWFGRLGRNFSVSLNRSGRLAYAGVIKAGKSVYGTDQFNEIVPSEILAAVRTLTTR